MVLISWENFDWKGQPSDLKGVDQHPGAFGYIQKHKIHPGSIQAAHAKNGQPSQCICIYISRASLGCRLVGNNVLTLLGGTRLQLHLFTSVHATVLLLT